MEERNIKISKEKAIEWLQSGNPTLKKLALQAFKEFELTELPTSWEEWLEQNPKIEGEYFISNSSKISSVSGDRLNRDANVLKIIKQAEAILALCKLMQIRDTYRQGWLPNWYGNESKYCVMFSQNQLMVCNFISIAFPFSFPTKELAEQFLNNFKEELELVKELL